jgi:hypothetical protein
METRAVVTVSRLWNNPKIYTIVDYVKDGGISMQMDMDDFVAAVKQEIGKVTWVFTQKEFERRVDEAVRNVIQGVKEESIKVV